jgi:hypothetical protein
MSGLPELKPTDTNYQGNKIDAQCFLQIDIISRMMMYSEDIAIFSTAFQNNQLFYEILDPKKDDSMSIDDLGSKIKSFYESVDNLSTEQVYKIMNYMSESEIYSTIDDLEFRELIIRNMRTSADSIKRILSLVGSFGRTHHPFFKRFKHACLPIGFNQRNDLDWDWLSGIQIINKAFISNIHPLLDPRIIPFSDKAIQSYLMLAKPMDRVLKDMIGNRIKCMELGQSGIVPLSGFDELCFSPSERKQWNRKIKDYYKSTKPVFDQDPLPANFTDNTYKQENYEWYMNLDKLLNEGREMGKKLEEYRKWLK